MRIGWLQTSPVRGDVAGNLATVRDLLSVSPRADLWVLPELFATGYLFADADEAAVVAEPASGGATCAFLQGLASSLSCAIVGGLVERAADGRLFNSAVAVDGTGVRAVYRKVHVFGEEKRWAAVGDLPFPVVDLAGVRVGLMICFDWRFPEVARTLALAGAQVIAHPSNLVLTTCPDAMVTRALENGVFTVTCDRVGVEEHAGLRAAFIGRSRVCGPDGAVLSEGPSVGTAVGVVEIDPGRADDKRVGSRNDLFGDRRPGLYRLE